MQNTEETRTYVSENNQHLYVYGPASRTVASYQLLKKIPNSHYLYVLSHVFTNPIKGMFGQIKPMTDKVEDLGHNILYVHKKRSKQ